MKIAVVKQRTAGAGLVDFYFALVEAPSQEAARERSPIMLAYRDRVYWQLGHERNSCEHRAAKLIFHTEAERHAHAAIAQAFPGIERLEGYKRFSCDVRTAHQGPDHEIREIEYDHPLHLEITPA